MEIIKMDDISQIANQIGPIDMDDVVDAGPIESLWMSEEVAHKLLEFARLELPEDDVEANELSNQMVSALMAMGSDGRQLTIDDYSDAHYTLGLDNDVEEADEVKSDEVSDADVDGIDDGGVRDEDSVDIDIDGDVDSDVDDKDDSGDIEEGNGCDDGDDGDGDDGDGDGEDGEDDDNVIEMVATEVEGDGGDAADDKDGEGDDVTLADEVSRFAEECCDDDLECRQANDNMVCCDEASDDQINAICGIINYYLRDKMDWLNDHGFGCLCEFIGCAPYITGEIRSMIFVKDGDIEAPAQ